MLFSRILLKNKNMSEVWPVVLLVLALGHMFLWEFLFEFKQSKKGMTFYSSTALTHNLNYFSVPLLILLVLTKETVLYLVIVPLEEKTITLIFTRWLYFS